MRRFLLALLSLSLALPLLATDWPQWRGPNRDGIAPGARLPVKWPAEAPEPKWKAAVGLGASGPAVAGGKVFIMGMEGKTERCLCLDANTGNELWKVEYEEPFVAPDPTVPRGPNSTPTVDKDRVFMFGVGGQLHCLDLNNGAVLWKHDCQKEYWGVQKNAELGDDAWFPPCGVATSPLVDGDTVIVAVGGKKAGAFTGFDRKTGKILWKALDDRSSYASPVIRSPGGVDQIIGFTGTRMVGLRRSDRELLWEMPFKARFEQTIVTPVVWKDLVIVGGEGRPTVALRIIETGGKVKAEKAWESPDLRTYLTTPVVMGDYLVGHDMRTNRVVCVSLDNGELAWTSPGVSGKYFSIVLAGDAVLVLNSEGELRAFKADPKECVELAKWKVSGKGVWAHLAVAGNRLYVKDKDTLFCYEL
jgi:outer membrane protein assembly factor BamB